MLQSISLGANSLSNSAAWEDPYVRGDRDGLVAYAASSFVALYNPQVSKHAQHCMVQCFCLFLHHSLPHLPTRIHVNIPIFFLSLTFALSFSLSGLVSHVSISSLDMHR